MAVHSPVNGTTAIPWRTSRKKLNLLEKLKGCEEAWCPKEPWDKEAARAAINGTPAGSFLILRDWVTSQPCLLCVSTADKHEPVKEWEVMCTDKVFQLSGSRLSFSDLAQLVLFYSFTRDALPVCLSMPHWLYTVTDKDGLSQMEPKMWLNADSEQQPGQMNQKGPGTVMCSIQLTAANGALCIINPLYLHEHGDEWLTCRTSRVQGSPTLSSPIRRDKRLSTSRPWSGAGLTSKRAISLDQDASAANNTGKIEENTGLLRARSADSSHNPLTSSAAAATVAPSSVVVLRRPSRDAPLTLPSNTHSLPPSPATPVPSDHYQGSPIPQSPHRVSWIEDGVWLPPPRPSSLLFPPSLELDSLSISSIEEEQDPQTPTTSHASSSQRLADKVKNRFSAVGQVLGGLVCPKTKLKNRMQEMSEKKGSPFAESVKGFVESTLNKGPERDGLTEFLQEVRSSLTSLRETLLEYSEIQCLLESMTDANDINDIDTFIERSLHKFALKPVSSHLYGCIQTSRSSDGTLDRFQSNLHRLQPKGVDELGGSADVGIPDTATLQKIQQKWDEMHKEYSPNKKVQILLKVCKSIYHSMSANANSGKAFGADDFLPCLTWVLLRSDVIMLQVDTDYMMELLDPTQLQGEGGYYLTTMYASLYYINSFKPRLAARQLSVEAQNSLNKWHRRRTMHCDRSRRSKTRQTIKRPSQHKRATQNSQNQGQDLKTASNNCDGVELKQEDNTEALKEMKEEIQNNGNGVSDVEEETKMQMSDQEAQPMTQDNAITDATDDILR